MRKERKEETTWRESSEATKGSGQTLHRVRMSWKICRKERDAGARERGVFALEYSA